MKSQSLFFAVASAVLLFLTPLSQAQSDADFGPPALGGYSPVSYFTAGEPQLGDAKFAVTHKGKRYFLTSEEQVALFDQDPDKYRPRHDVCTYSLALGMVRPLNPTKFKIVNDSLLLFHVDETKDALFEWNRAQESEEELLRRADNNLFLVKF
ncbi:MAG: hypothetical protein AB8G16_04400 [Gammaproteobacteria bacterium]